MPYLNCKICDKEFYTKPNWIKLGHGKYCSRACTSQSQKKGKIILCDICKKESYKSPKNLKTSKSKKYFCSKSCQTIWRNTVVFIGKNHSNWKGGNSTYKSILFKSDVSKKCKRCKLTDIRILAVHHIDENRKNNNLKNLTWLCHNCHHLIHRYKKEKIKFMEVLV